MNGLDSRFSSWLVWLLPFAAGVVLLGWETNWGRGLTAPQPIPPAPAAQPVSVALLPEYALDGGIESRRETVDRTLFNPTRRPAPPAPVQDAAKPRMQRGQFQLTGTAVVDQKAIAFLRETNGGKPRSVRAGDTINGVTVAEVKPDRVRLVQGDESEELVLRVAAGPRNAPPPATPPGVPPQPQPGGTPPVPGAVPPNTAAAGQPGAPDVVDVGSTATLLERRRAARAAAAAAQQAQQAQGQPAPPAAPAAPAAAQQQQTDWANVYQQMQQRQRSTKP